MSKAAGALLVAALPAMSAAADVRFEDFVGSESCAPCHQEQHRAWSASTHGNAGGPPSAETVISEFDGTTLRFKDALVRLTVQENGDHVFTVRQQGLPDRSFTVEGVVGRGHMQGGGAQSYFVRHADGTLRLMPFEYSAGGGWNCQLADNQGSAPLGPELSLSDCREWPPQRILGSSSNFRAPCHNCHGSQIVTEFLPAENRHRTRYATLQINCESCHGPGRRHLEIMTSGGGENDDIGMAALATLGEDASIDVCLQCHAHKVSLETEPYLPGDDFQTHYSTKLHRWSARDFHLDGRIRSFAYQKNHLFSDCYVSGTMTCVDCHDPHSQSYRDIHGNELRGRFDDRQCTGCHASKAGDPEAHTHHPPGSDGARCTSCHMPYLQHPIVGRRIRIARSDHTIAIPRPAFDAALGIEGACRQCHGDRSVSSLQATVDAWYGAVKPHPPGIRAMVDAQGVTDRVAAASLVLADAGKHVMAQIGSLTYFTSRFLTPDMPVLEPSIVHRLRELAGHDDPDVQAQALASLHVARGNDPAVRVFLDERRTALGPPVLRRWVEALKLLAADFYRRGAADASAATYGKALELAPDDALTLTQMGVASTARGQLDAAMRYYARSLAARPHDAKTRVLLADLLIQLGRGDEAIPHYRQALSIRPDVEEAQITLGRMLQERGDASGALDYLEEAVGINPANPEARLALATCLVSLEREPEAREHFMKAYEQALEQGRQDVSRQARDWLEKLQDGG